MSGHGERQREIARIVDLGRRLFSQLSLATPPVRKFCEQLSNLTACRPPISVATRRQKVFSSPRACTLATHASSTAVVSVGQDWDVAGLMISDGESPGSNIRQFALSREPTLSEASRPGIPKAREYLEVRGQKISVF